MPRGENECVHYILFAIMVLLTFEAKSSSFASNDENDYDITQQFSEDDGHRIVLEDFTYLSVQKKQYGASFWLLLCVHLSFSYRWVVPKLRDKLV